MITIIVMLILVAVTINIVAKGNLFDYARDAKKRTNLKIEEERNLSSGTVDGKTIEEIVNDGEKDRGTFTLLGPEGETVETFEFTIGDTWSQFVEKTNPSECYIEGETYTLYFDVGMGNLYDYNLPNGDWVFVHVVADDWEDELPLATSTFLSDGEIWSSWRNYIISANSMIQKDAAYVILGR